MKLQRRKDVSGFTIIEAMIAMAILTFGILGVASLQMTALRRSSTSRYSLAASQVAKNQMAQIRRLPWNVVLETANNGADWQLLCATVPLNNGGGCIAGSVGEAGYPGAIPNTLPTVSLMQTSVDGVAHSLVTYQVQWRVQDVIGAVPSPKECRKDIFIRVTWREKAFENVALSPLREYYLSTRIFNNLGDRNADGPTDLNMAAGTESEGC